MKHASFRFLLSASAPLVLFIASTGWSGDLKNPVEAYQQACNNSSMKGRDGSHMMDTTNSEQQVKTQKVCPVYGGEINPQLFVDYHGERVYFCCSGCEELFMEKPEEYVKKLNSQGVHLEKAPAIHESESHDLDHQHGRAS